MSITAFRLRRQPRAVPTWVAIVLVAGACTTACKGSGGSGGGGGLDSPLDPSKPPAGLDTTQRQMTDGAGNPGPVQIRLLSVRPDLNAQVVGTPAGSTGGKCNQSAPWSCFEFSVEFCMNAVANPTGSPLLNNMKLSAVFSADGTTAISRGGFPYPEAPPGILVQPGTCKTYQTPLDMKGDYPAEGVPRYLMLLVSYGSAEGFSVNQTACPTPAAIATNGIVATGCSFRAVYDLGYHY